MSLNESNPAIELGEPVQLEADFMRTFKSTYGEDHHSVVGLITLDTNNVPPILKTVVGFTDAEGPSTTVEMMVETVPEAIDFTKVDARTLELAQIALKDFRSAVNFGGVVKSSLRIKH